MSMRVVHVAPTAFGTAGLFGGGERYPLELARALAATGGLDCELVTFGRSPGVRREPSGLLVRVLRPVAHLGGHPAQPLAPGLAAAVRRADVVHTHQASSAPSRHAAWAAGRDGAVVTTDHGLGGDASRRWAQRFALLLAVSGYSVRTLGWRPDRARVVHGGVDADRFRPEPAATREGVLFVGRLTPHKGVDRLLRALPPGVPLTVAGTPGHDRRRPERDYPALLASLARGRAVRFRTAVPDAELPGLHRRAAVFALPSVEVTCYERPVAITELLGLSLLEAMASGTPVVASRTGGIPEVVVDGETGFLVEPGDVDALRDRLATLLGDRRLAHRMGDAGRDAVLDRLTWAACADRCLSAYREVVS
jgi:glycosyltransferase involved in cell wall biosynthesis